jgi:hypothetical protein
VTSFPAKSYRTIAKRRYQNRIDRDFACRPIEFIAKEITQMSFGQAPVRLVSEAKF